MPSASDELRDRMGQRFGDRIDDRGPIRFLMAASYEAREDFCWGARPGVRTEDDITPEEAECILFLIEEWDFGGVVFDA